MGGWTIAAIINKIKSKTNALVWKHDFEKQEWLAFLSFMFIVRDFMFFFPTIDGDDIYEEIVASGSRHGRMGSDSYTVLRREPDVGQLLRKAPAGKFPLVAAQCRVFHELMKRACGSPI